MTSSGEPGLLSIAIPVYNFRRFLPSTLESILPQALERGVEVLVFDGGSTDDTPSLARRYATRFPNLRYVRALNKGGIDADMARSVELVSAPYCWLFSGDDIMRPCAVDRVMATLADQRPDLLLLRHNECHLDMSVLKDWPVLSLTEDKVFDLSATEQRKLYLESACSSEAFFSFMGGLVVKRRTWFQGWLDPRFVGSNWAHVARLWSLMRQTFILSYIHDVMLDRRGGNDSFSQAGMLSRLEIQINGLLDTVGGVFGESSAEFLHVRRVVTGEVLPHWANAVRADLAARAAPPADFARLDRLLGRLGQPA